MILNWRGFYYGDKSASQAQYQIAAKGHEITIQASLALIVLAHIRYEATHGTGIPFGAFLGGLQFLQVGYLLSPELWSVITAKNFQLQRKIGILIMLITCGILATTVEPSSATLLIPREISWPLSWPHFAINGSFEDLWPDNLDARIVPEECKVLPVDGVHRVCPGGPWSDYYAILQYEREEVGPTGEIAMTKALIQETFEDPSLPFSETNIAQLCDTSTEDQMCATKLQDVVAGAAFSNVIDYKVKLKFTKQSLDFSHSFSKDYYQPYTIASCHFDIIDGSNVKQPLQFPRLSETQAKIGRPRSLTAVMTATRSTVLEASGNASEFRLEWLELPQDSFNDRVIGATLIFPTNQYPNTPFKITACTLGAGWGSSKGSFSESCGNSFQSSIFGVPKTFQTASSPFP